MEHNRKFIGRTSRALVTGRLEEMELLLDARLARQAPEIDGRLLINDGTAPAASMVDVEITEAHPYDLVGKIVRVVRPGPELRSYLPVVG